MKFSNVNILIIFILFLLPACNSSTEPEKPLELTPYMSIDVGDLRQYYDPAANIYLQWEVMDTINRTDGQTIYNVEESILSPDGGLFKATNYYFIKDNYFYITIIDSLGSNLGNSKFSDMKCAMVHPQKDDCFLSNEDDTTEVYFKVDFVDSMITRCGKFIDVAKYEKIDNSTTKQFIYYAPNIGHIGSTLINSTNKESNFLAIYIKTGKDEIGEYTQFPISKRNYKNQGKPLINIFNLKKTIQFYLQ